MTIGPVWRRLGAAVVITVAAWFIFRSTAFTAGPAPFTGVISCTEIVSGGTAGSGEGVTHNRGEIYAATADIDEPRLAGAHTIFFGADNYVSAESRSSVGSGTWLIEDDLGSWQGAYHVVGLPADGGVRTSTTTMVPGSIQRSRLAAREISATAMIPMPRSGIAVMNMITPCGSVSIASSPITWE